MKSYYDFHEEHYKKLSANGKVGRGGAATVDDLGDEKTKMYLGETVAHYFPNREKVSALDLGCGSGTTAFLLARIKPSMLRMVLK